jgi:DNA-binding response OmpR family regulator
MIENLESLIKSYGKPLQILYVEDNEKARVSTLSILNKYFTDVDVCVDGLEGLETFKSKEGKYDVIITDLDMPNMDGLEMISKIREIDDSMYIVIFSTYNDTEYFIESISLGIDGYILKPFNLKQFLKMAIKMMNHFVDKETPTPTLREVLLYGGYKWNIEENTLYQNDEKIKLSNNENALISCLVSNIDKVTSNNELGKYIFDDFTLGDSIKIRNLISKLKNKIDPELIESTYGVGYQLKK